MKKRDLARFDVIFCSKSRLRRGLHTNSTPRYNEANAQIAWDRTIAFFTKNPA